MAHVLIGFAEALPAPEVVFSLRRAGHRVSAFARQSNLPLKHLDLQDLRVIPAPEEAADRAILAAADILSVSNDAPDIFLPLDDAGLWLANALDATDRIAGATGPQATAALDKAIQIAHAKAAGLDVPQTWDETTLAKGIECTHYPVIAKPALALRVANNMLGKGAPRYLDDRDAAESFLAERDPKDEPFLAQPLIIGRGEGVFGFASAEGVVGWSGHKRVRMMNPHGSGSSACESFKPDPGLCERIEIFLKSLNWRGAFMVELLRDTDGTPWFMELNGRMWGSMALARRQALEYPAWNVSQAQNPEFVPDVPILSHERLVQRHLGREILHVLFTIRGPKSDFHKSSWPRLSKSVAGVFKPGRAAGFYNYDPEFPHYYLRDAYWTVKKAFRR